MNYSPHERLFLCELLYDDEKEEFYVNDKEITKVDVNGTIVSLCAKEKFTCFDLDDITGTISCVQFHNNKFTPAQREPAGTVSEPLKELLASVTKYNRPLKLGDTVNIRGRLNLYCDKPQIICNIIRHINDPNEIWFRIREIDALRNLQKSQTHSKKD